LSSVSARNKAMRASKCAPGAEFDILPSVLYPMRDRDEGWNAEIAGDVEHPKPAAGLGELLAQIADVGIVELAEIQFRPLQSVVPPDRIGIPLNQLEEALDDRLFERIAGRAAVRIGAEGSWAAVEEIEKARRKIFEASIAQ
jgi:hypothetical protein